jgi:hypothetical protein
MTEHLNQYHVAVLTALRNAAALRREPKILTPDGREQWFSLRELSEEGQLAGLPVGVLEPAARTLRKRGLIAGRTLSGILRYAVDEPGSMVLAALEERAGITGLVAADLAVAQARMDARLARRREAAALAKRSGLALRHPSYAEIAAFSEEVYQ